MIVTPRLALHPLRASDADEMFHVLNDDALHTFTGGRPLGLEELRLRYERLARGSSEDRSQTWLNWIVRTRVEWTAVGTVQATITEDVESQHARIAWVVGVPWQRRGIASEATVVLIEELERRGIHRISASIHPEHAASQRVAVHAGLRLTDKVADGEQVWELQH